MSGFLARELSLCCLHSPQLVPTSLCSLSFAPLLPWHLSCTASGHSKQCLSLLCLAPVSLLSPQALLVPPNLVTIALVVLSFRFQDSGSPSPQTSGNMDRVCIQLWFSHGTESQRQHLTKPQGWTSSSSLQPPW